jgi:hypothetical protein
MPWWWGYHRSGINPPRLHRISSFAAARAKKEEYITQLRELEYEEKSRKLVDAELVGRRLNELARGLRNAFMQFPAQVAPLIAAKLGPIRPNPPVSQSLSEVADPRYGLSTHPDIVEIMWKLDDELPQRCRWVFWGRPALVHPETGVVFSVGFGTIGHLMRLPPQVLEAAAPQRARTVVSGNPGQTFDISPAGPEWRFVSLHAREAQWCRAAYEFAGILAP